MRKIPFYPILLAMFSVMSLLANNIHEVDPSVSIRSFIIIGILSIVIMLFMKVIFKDWHKAALASSLIVLMLMSYGHIYDALRSIPQVGLEISRHRFSAGGLGAMRLEIKMHPVEYLIDGYE